MKKVMTFMLTFGLFAFLTTGCGGNSSSGDKAKEVKKEMTVNLDNGKTIYNKACIACHMKGVAGAAALTDKPRWEEMAAKGMETLQKHAIAGFQGEYGVMPEKGTCVDCSDQDIYDAIGYMLKESGVTAK